MLGSIYAMVAVALTLSIGVLRFLNFSIPGLFMIGGMTAWASLRAGLPWPLAIAAALVAGAFASLVVERFTWRWMRGAQDFVPLVSSMAFLLLFEHLAVIYWGSELRTVPPLFANADWRVAGLVISLPQLGGLVASIALIWALTLATGTYPPRPRPAHDRRRFRYRAAARRRDQSHRPGGIPDQRLVRRARRRDLRVELPPGASVHGRNGRSQGHLGHDRRRHGQRLGLDRRRTDHRPGRGDVDRVFRRRLRRHRGLRTAAAHSVRPTDRTVRRQLSREQRA